TVSQLFPYHQYFKEDPPIALSGRPGGSPGLSWEVEVNQRQLCNRGNWEDVETQPS
ncbi:hypothetical protein Tco_0618956, partial [Tanacetum coccineum]